MGQSAGMPNPFRLRLGFVLLALLAGCTTVETGPVIVPPPSIRPGAPVFAEPEIRAPSAESLAARAYYARVQANLQSQGLLRTDGGGRDTPYSARQLAESFLKIALYDEYVASNGALVARTTESRLRRWDAPVRLGIEFGPSVPAAQRVKDRGDLAAFGARLASASGHPVRLDQGNANFTVLMLNEDERRSAGPLVQRIVPGIDRSAIRAIADMPPSTYCVVFAFAAGPEAAYSRALAVIRAEHPDLLRLSCIHEEVAQGMGLANDSPRARPSIFNDDEEFALLTRQDELMLKMLYDPRLRTGMSLSEARPVVATIAEELLGGES